MISISISSDQDGPHHGILQLVDPKTNILIRNNLTYFTYYNVEDGEVRYKHDDSETLDDFFLYKQPVYKHAQPQILGKFKHIAKHAPG